MCFKIIMLEWILFKKRLFKMQNGEGEREGRKEREAETDCLLFYSRMLVLTRPRPCQSCVLPMSGRDAGT